MAVLDLDEIERLLKTRQWKTADMFFEITPRLIARIRTQDALLAEARETLAAYHMCNVGCGDCDPLRDLLAKLDEALKP